MHNAYQTSTPDDMDTIYGFFSQDNPEAFDLLGDPINDLASDVLNIQAEAHRRNTHGIIVEAPPALQERGIAYTIAYQVDFLREMLT